MNRQDFDSLEIEANAAPHIGTHHIHFPRGYDSKKLWISWKGDKTCEHIHIDMNPHVDIFHLMKSNMAILRYAYVEIETKKIDREIKKEMQKMHSWEISEDQYDERYNCLMQKYELLVANLLPNIP